MQIRNVLCVTLLCAPVLAWGFVSKLNPNDGPLPCHQTAAMLEGYVRGLYGAVPNPGRTNLGNAITNIYLAPASPPQSWSPEDGNDNTAFLTALDALPTLGDKLDLIGWMERLCMAWEQDHPQVNTPNAFRTLLGIPTQ